MTQQYLVSDSVNGEPSTLHGEYVDAEYVTNYTSIEARRFFLNLGAAEEMRKTKSGIIVCKSTSPDGETVRTVRFIPHLTTEEC